MARKRRSRSGILALVALVTVGVIAGFQLLGSERSPAPVVPAADLPTVAPEPESNSRVTGSVAESGENLAFPDRPERSTVPAERSGLTHVKGLVLDDAGQPIVGATVELRTAYLSLHSANCAPDGRFVIIHGPVELILGAHNLDDGLRCIASAPGFTTEQRRVHQSRSEDGVDVGTIRLARQARLRGRLVSATGEPIEGGSVCIRHRFSSPKQIGLPTDGRFDLALDFFGELEVLTLADRHVWSEPMLVVIRPGEVLDLGDLVLDAGRTVSGVVVDLQGRGIVDAHVALVDAHTPFRNLPRTDASGAFELQASSRAEVMLRVSHPLHRSEQVPVIGDEPVRVVLSPSALVEGVVRDRETGLPITNAVVGSGNQGATTGADGRFALRLDRATELRVDAVGHAPLIVPIAELPEPPQAIDLRMDRESVLTGFVHHEGLPIGSATVRVFVDGARRMGGARTADDGSFRISELGPGMARLHATTSDGAGSAEVELTAGATRHVEIALLLRRDLSGQIVGGGAYVVSCPEEEGLRIHPVTDGVFRCEGALPGRIALAGFGTLAAAERFARDRAPGTLPEGCLVVEVRDSDLTGLAVPRIELEVTGVSGRALDRGLPAAGYRVLLRPRASAEGARLLGTQVARDGSWSIDAVPTGDYRLALVAPTPIGTVEYGTVLDELELAGTDLRVDGGSTSHELRAGSARLVVRGAPAAGELTIQADGEPLPLARGVAARGFVAPAIPLTIRCRYPDGTVIERRAHPLAGATVELDFTH